MPDERARSLVWMLAQMRQMLETQALENLEAHGRPASARREAAPDHLQPAEQRQWRRRA
jgi:hypothetical protein